MLRQQELNQAKEDLAARDAEVQELQSRVAELEKLQKDQAALIAMKDSKLAAAEQRLAQSNDAAAKATTATTAQQQPAQQTGTPAWLWGGAGLLMLGVLAWLFTRRRATRVEQPARRAYDTEALAAGIPTAEDVAPRERAAPAPATPEQAPAFAAAPPRAKETPHWTAAPATLGAAPTWHGGATGDNTAVAEPQTAMQQLELARAYLDMGDDDAARVILREVLDGRDPAARDTAARMLREL
ncbi:FimV C-terminal domain protein [Lysobacter dokdonensis DS-58]|uniref:FimV C-terminal domain protein n=2 Tax=Noviluteimonas TaxID=3382693 RepID=A0A0A2WLR3_9GAMM|nr:FimV C-terminal domain protein [Lysobacter dokdonensis DS-58]